MHPLLKVDDTRLRVSEVFATIQGEGINTGVPSIFVRLSLCNLACPTCFVAGTFISTPTGQKKIESLSIGDTVFGFDFEQNKIVATTVLNTFQHTVSPDNIYLVQAGNKKVFCTPEHEFYVKGKGWVLCSDLKVGDTVYDISPSFCGSYYMQAERNPMKDKETQFKVSAKMKELHSSGQFHWEMSPAARKKMSEKMIGNKNPMKDPDVVRKSAESSFKGPSQLELQYMRLFKSLPIKYVGNNKLTVGNTEKGYVFPDFQVVGKKKVIEIYNTKFPFYASKGKKGPRTSSWEKERKDFLASFGYDVLFLTEKDVKKWEEKVIPYINNGRKITKIVSALSSRQRARLGYPTRRSKNSLVNVYNIETSTHNYYANTMLVHNCDTFYTWAWEGTSKFGTDMNTGEKIQADPSKEIIEMTADDVLRAIQLQSNTIKNIVLTGGEPLMQQSTKVFKDLLQILSQNGYTIEIETNGTLVPSETTCKYVSQFNVSPKLTSFNSVDTKESRWKSKPFMFYAEYPNAWFKFVIASQEDIKELHHLGSRYGINPQRILLMPEGRTPEQLARNTEVIVEMCKQNGYRFCNRLHVQIYGGAIRRV